MLPGGLVYSKSVDEVDIVAPFLFSANLWAYHQAVTSKHKGQPHGALVRDDDAGLLAL